MRPPDSGSPILIAHRAGNDPIRLRKAESAGVDLIECDLWLYHDRLEVRHEKTAGPLPVLWDRWSLAPGWRSRWTLTDLLRSASHSTELFFDLKGWNARLPGLLLAIIAEEMPDRPFSVSSQNWELLRPFRTIPQVTTFYSIGNPRQLRAFPGQIEPSRKISVSIHSKLLTPSTIAYLRGRSDHIIPWKIRTMAHAQQLLAWGVDGLNVDDPSLLRELVRKGT